MAQFLVLILIYLSYIPTINSEIASLITTNTYSSSGQSDLSWISKDTTIPNGPTLFSRTQHLKYLKINKSISASVNSFKSMHGSAHHQAIKNIPTVHSFDDLHQQKATINTSYVFQPSIKLYTSKSSSTPPVTSNRTTNFMMQSLQQLKKHTPQSNIKLVLLDEFSPSQTFRYNLVS